VSSSSSWPLRFTVRLRQALEYGAIPVIDDFSDFKGCDVSGLPWAVNTARGVAEDTCARGLCYGQDPSGWLSDAPVYTTSDWSDFATLLSDALSDTDALDAKQAELVSQERGAVLERRRSYHHHWST
jgi:hypothetical protein